MLACNSRERLSRIAWEYGTANIRSGAVHFFADQPCEYPKNWGYHIWTQKNELHPPLKQLDKQALFDYTCFKT